MCMNWIEHEGFWAVLASNEKGTKELETMDVLMFVTSPIVHASPRHQIDVRIFRWETHPCVDGVSLTPKKLRNENQTSNANFRNDAGRTNA